MSRTNAAFGEIRIPAAEIDALRERAIRAESERDALRAEVERLRGQVRRLVCHCTDPECEVCGEIVCPHGDPLHYHHDGCPACCGAALSSPPSGG